MNDSKSAVKSQLMSKGKVDSLEEVRRLKQRLEKEKEYSVQKELLFYETAREIFGTQQAKKLMRGSLGKLWFTKFQEIKNTETGQKIYSQVRRALGNQVEHKVAEATSRLITYILGREPKVNQDIKDIVEFDVENDTVKIYWEPKECPIYQLAHENGKPVIDFCRGVSTPAAQYLIEQENPGVKITKEKVCPSTNVCIEVISVKET